MDDLPRRLDAVEARLVHLETKWDAKLDRLQDRINILVVAAAATLASVTLALFAILLSRL